MLRLTSSDFYAAATEARNADKKVIRELRRGIRLAGQDTVAQIKSEIGRIPSSGGSGTGVRAALQAGTRVSISTASAKSAAVRLITDPRRLPMERRALAKAMNLHWWRHPVFADPDAMRDSRTKGFRDLKKHRESQGRTLKSWTWVEQMGRPYFGDVILRYRQEMEAELWRALKRAEQDVMAQQQKAGSDVR